MGRYFILFWIYVPKSLFGSDIEHGLSWSCLKQRIFTYHGTQKSSEYFQKRLNSESSKPRGKCLLAGNHRRTAGIAGKLCNRPYKECINPLCMLCEPMCHVHVSWSKIIRFFFKHCQNSDPWRPHRKCLLAGHVCWRRSGEFGDCQEVMQCIPWGECFIRLHTEFNQPAPKKRL